MCSCSVVLSHLRSFGAVTGLVFGWFGEINIDFDNLLCTAAEIGAERLWSDLNCTTIEHAKGVLVWSLRRKMAAAIARANVDHLFGRISLLTGDPNAAASRRAASQARFFRNHDPAFSTHAHHQARRGAAGFT
jgi:hypothetical protein